MPFHALEGLDWSPVAVETATPLGLRTAPELATLTEGEQSATADGLVAVQPHRIDVEPIGRMFVRNICMIFDKYLALRTAGPKPVFSRTV